MADLFYGTAKKQHTPEIWFPVFPSAHLLAEAQAAGQLDPSTAPVASADPDPANPSPARARREILIADNSGSQASNKIPPLVCRMVIGVALILEL